MTKSNFLGLILIGCFLSVSATACTTNKQPSLTAVPLPSMTPSSVPVDAPLIATTGGFFALSVADINASADWYSEKLGLKVIMQPPKANGATVIVLEGGSLIVELIQQDDARSLSEVAPTITDKTLIHGIVKVGAIVEDFDKTVEILKERNVSIAFGPFPATADQRANIIIQDNEGNLIQFFGQ